jgi:hypothetical protein
MKTVAVFVVMVAADWSCEDVHSHDFVRLLLVACIILLYKCIHTEG